MQILKKQAENGVIVWIYYQWILAIAHAKMASGNMIINVFPILTEDVNPVMTNLIIAVNLIYQKIKKKKKNHLLLRLFNLIYIYLF